VNQNFKSNSFCHSQSDCYKIPVK